MTISLSRSGDVWVLSMDEGENRFNRSTVTSLLEAVGEVAMTPGPAALVTVGAGKYFSNGLDLDWLLSPGAEGTDGFIDDVYRLFGLVLGLDVATVAAVNGHAFAGGAMLAAAHDLAVMRADRGYWCVPEVDLGLPLAVPMYEVLATRVPRPVLADAMLTGRRLGGGEAASLGVVTEAVEGDEAVVLARAVELAAPLAGKDRSVLAEHKRLLHAPALRACGVL